MFYFIYKFLFIFKIEKLYEMVCISCFIYPIAIWIWFTFIMPLLFKLKTIIFKTPQSNNAQNVSEDGKTQQEPQDKQEAQPNFELKKSL
jgi:hypothetical protein